MNKLLFTAILLFAGACLTAQPVEREPGEVVVQLQPDVSLPAFLQHLRSLPYARYEAPIAANWRIHLVHIDESPVNPEESLLAIRNLPGVKAAHWNAITKTRNTEPNDSDWFRQESMQQIGAPAAWDFSMGGLTPQGDTIVVAVLEKGALRTHPDLDANWWYNWQEIPNDDIDNDGNGYVDDFRGWDVRTKTDSQGNSDNHGTQVNGIIGAAGNNGVGVSGVNWHVKLLNIANTEKVSEIIAAYRYVDTMRQLYNQTNGQKGAFIVVTNASFGIDFGKPSTYPEWCEIYDSLGAHGVLNVCATINENENVDVVGDMPTTCPSPYMIAVTSVDKNDQKMAGAGYGPVSIDLAAPGDDVYSTRNNGSGTNPVPTYGYGDGTSFATPHVTGTVALLYSLNCANFTSDALTNPAGAAERVRDVILSSGTPTNTLQDVTVTGARLNLSAAVQSVTEYCGGVVGPLEVIEIRGTFGRGPLTVFYQTPDFEPYDVRVFNMLGQLVHEEKVYPQQFTVNFFEYEYRHLPAGAYVFTLGKGDDYVAEKFLKM
ncbi:MAG: S8 family peptidase [Saprospiraceae bacterium]|nr:S8 family peptidase [Saprospiraceae bacterium]